MRTDTDIMDRIEQLQQELDEALSFDLPTESIQVELNALSKRQGGAINIAPSALICNDMFTI